MLGLNWIKKDMFRLLIIQLDVHWLIKLYIECTHSDLWHGVSGGNHYVALNNGCNKFNLTPFCDWSGTYGGYLEKHVERGGGGGREGGAVVFYSKTNWKPCMIFEAKEVMRLPLPPKHIRGFSYTVQLHIN